MSKKLIETNDIFEAFGDFDAMKKSCIEEGGIENPTDDQVWEYAHQVCDDNIDATISNIKFSQPRLRVIVAGGYQRWDGSHEVYKVFDSLAEAFKGCIPEYDASCKWYLKDGRLTYEEASHDAPMGGTELYFYIINMRGEHFLENHSDTPDGSEESLLGKRGLTRMATGKDIGL